MQHLLAKVAKGQKTSKDLTWEEAKQAMRLMIEGKPEDQVQVAVRSDLEKLARVGGASDPDRFGPRLRKVFDSLR